MLSGGEKVRLALCKIFKTKPNFLILDEPTNHMDIVGKESLEDMLKEFPGSVLFVSHDRYFVNQTATRILELVNETFVNYIGNYDYYLEKKEILTNVYAPSSITTNEKKDLSTDTKMDWKAQKEAQAKERKRQNDLKKTENRIEELEQLLSDLNDEMSLPENATNSAKLNEIAEKQAVANEELEPLYELWEELSEE